MTETQTKVATLPASVVQWLASGERGTSSNTIVQKLTGVKCLGRYCGEGCHPLDPDDLRRCMLLLEACPELRPELHRMSSVSPVWAALVNEWDSLIASLKEEMKRPDKMARLTYARMKQLGC